MEDEQQKTPTAPRRPEIEGGFESEGGQAMSSSEYEWIQADLGAAANSVNNGLISLVAWDRTRSPKLIGTAFTVCALGGSAVAITAAHNLKGIRDAQQPRARHHPSSPLEFLGDMEQVNLDRKLVRAICSDRKGIQLCLIVWAAWDKASDIGVLGLETQTKGDDFFKSSYLPDSQPPTIGEEVCVLGYAEMAIEQSEKQLGGWESFVMSRRPLLRRGKVTGIHPDGHFLCRGPCIETSIPVFSGMSGGPAFRFGAAGQVVAPFGVISSDPDEDDDVKNNQKMRGASIVALLQGTSVSDKRFLLKLNSAYVQGLDHP